MQGIQPWMAGVFGKGHLCVAQGSVENLDTRGYVKGWLPDGAIDLWGRQGHSFLFSPGPPPPCRKSVWSREGEQQLEI